MSVRVELVVLEARSRTGSSYVFGAEAKWSDPDPHAFDCSELVEWSCHRAGLADVPDGSKAQYAWCRAHTTTVPVSVGIRTRGALLFRLTGDPTHVAISLGDGRTIEARGRRYGVNEFPAGGRGWTHAALIPGADYSTIPTPGKVKPGMVLNIKGSPYNFYVRGCDDGGALVLVAITEAQTWELAAAGAAVISVSKETFDVIRMGPRWHGSEAA